MIVKIIFITLLAAIMVFMTIIFVRAMIVERKKQTKRTTESIIHFMLEKDYMPIGNFKVMQFRKKEENLVKVIVLDTKHKKTIVALEIIHKVQLNQSQIERATIEANNDEQELIEFLRGEDE